MARIKSQPCSLSAQIFARLLTCVGGIVCFLPWRDKITTSTFPILPIVNSDVGSPKGVSILMIFGDFKIFKGTVARDEVVHISNFDQNGMKAAQIRDEIDQRK